MSDDIFNRCFKGCSNNLYEMDEIADAFQTCIGNAGCTSLLCQTNMFNKLKQKCKDSPFNPKPVKPKYKPVIIRPTSNPVMASMNTTDTIKTIVVIGSIIAMVVVSIAVIVETRKNIRHGYISR